MLFGKYSNWYILLDSFNTVATKQRKLLVSVNHTNTGKPAVVIVLIWFWVSAAVVVVVVVACMFSSESRVGFFPWLGGGYLLRMRVDSWVTTINESNMRFISEK